MRSAELFLIPHFTITNSPPVPLSPKPQLMKIVENRREGEIEDGILVRGFPPTGSRMLVTDVRRVPKVVAVTLSVVVSAPVVREMRTVAVSETVVKWNRVVTKR